MPLYEYNCTQCSWHGEIYGVAYIDRGAQKCPKCESALWSPVPKFKTGSESFQMGAVMGDGSVVKGHFGREAKADSLKRSKRLEKRKK